MANNGELAFKGQISRIKQNIANAYTQASQKGATMPSIQNSNNLASTIASITTGGGGTGTNIYDLILLGLNSSLPDYLCDQIMYGAYIVEN